MPSTCVILQALAQRKMYLKNRIQEMVMLIIEIQFLLDSFMIEYCILNVHLNKHFCKCHLPVKAIITPMCVHGAQYGLRNFLKENCGLNLSVKSNFQLHFSIIIEIKDEIASHCYQNISKNGS